MIKEIDLFGVFIPPLLAYAALAAVIWKPLAMALERLGLHRFAWHPALFNLALYVVVLAGVVAALTSGEF